MSIDDTDAYWAEVQAAVDAHLEGADLEHLEALGREYVGGLKMARELRELADKNPFTELSSGRIVANPLFEAADRAARGAGQLVKTLGLHKPAQNAANDPLSELDAELGDLSDLANARRRRRSRRASA